MNDFKFSKILCILLALLSFFTASRSNELHVTYIQSENCCNEVVQQNIEKYKLFNGFTYIYEDAYLLADPHSLFYINNKTDSIICFYEGDYTHLIPLFFNPDQGIVFGIDKLNKSMFLLQNKEELSGLYEIRYPEELEFSDIPKHSFLLNKFRVLQGKIELVVTIDNIAFDYKIEKPKKTLNGNMFIQSQSVKVENTLPKVPITPKDGIFCKFCKSANNIEGGLLSRNSGIMDGYICTKCATIFYSPSRKNKNVLRNKVNPNSSHKKRELSCLTNNSLPTESDLRQKRIKKETK